MTEKLVGIVVEIRSEKKYLGKYGKDREEFWVNDGQITNCVVLPRGCVFDNIAGLKFQIDVEKGDRKRNVFWVP